MDQRSENLFKVMYTLNKIINDPLAILEKWKYYRVDKSINLTIAILIVPGYTEAIPYSKKETCSNHISGALNSSFEACTQLCNDESDCNFFFFNDGNWCGLFKNCDERKVSGLASTYKKRMTA